MISKLILISALCVGWLSSAKAQSSCAAVWYGIQPRLLTFCPYVLTKTGISVVALDIVAQHVVKVAQVVLFLILTIRNAPQQLQYVFSTMQTLVQFYSNND